MSDAPRNEQRHPLAVRLTHWLIALFILVMTGSGWRIYNASPIFTYGFPGAATPRLEHRLGAYNAVHKVFYRGVRALIALMLVSGIAIWKPVRTYPLELAFGGFQGTRIVHFLGISGIVAFVLVHVALVVLAPKTFVTTLYVTNQRPRGFWTGRGYNWFSGI